MIINKEWIEELDYLYQDKLEHYANFIINFVLEGRLVKQSQAIEVSVSESEFNKS